MTPEADARVCGRRHLGLLPFSLWRQPALVVRWDEKVSTVDVMYIRTCSDFIRALIVVALGARRTMIPTGAL